MLKTHPPTPTHPPTHPHNTHNTHTHTHTHTHTLCEHTGVTVNRRRVKEGKGDSALLKASCTSICFRSQRSNETVLSILFSLFPPELSEAHRASNRSLVPLTARSCLASNLMLLFPHPPPSLSRTLQTSPTYLPRYCKYCCFAEVRRRLLRESSNTCMIFLLILSFASGMIISSQDNNSGRSERSKNNFNVNKKNCTEGGHVTDSCPTARAHARTHTSYMHTYY